MYEWGSHLFIVCDKGLNGAELEDEVGPDHFPRRLALEGGIVVEKRQVQIVSFRRRRFDSALRF